MGPQKRKGTKCDLGAVPKEVMLGAKKTVQAQHSGQAWVQSSKHNIQWSKYDQSDTTFSPLDAALEGSTAFKTGAPRAASNMYSKASTVWSP